MSLPSVHERAQPWLSLAARLLLAAVFAAAGWPKLLDREGTVRSVRAFRMMPEAAVRPFAYGLPAVELVLAVLLLVGLATRIAALATSVLMLMFVVGIVAAWSRGLAIDCGCFGNTGGTVLDPVPGYVRDLFRDAGLLGAALYLGRFATSRLCLDGALGVVHPDPRWVRRGDAGGSPTSSRTSIGA